jgi:hypothetical protein
VRPTERWGRNAGGHGIESDGDADRIVGIQRRLSIGTTPRVQRLLSDNGVFIRHVRRLLAAAPAAGVELIARDADEGFTSFTAARASHGRVGEKATHAQIALAVLKWATAGAVPYPPVPSSGHCTLSTAARCECRRLCPFRAAPFPFAALSTPALHVLGADLCIAAPVAATPRSSP